MSRVTIGVLTRVTCDDARAPALAVRPAAAAGEGRRGGAHLRAAGQRQGVLPRDHREGHRVYARISSNVTKVICCDAEVYMTILWQVVTGGHYDVDVVLTDPTRKVLYKQVKKQYDR